jgi:CDP-glycerol glycerophosphotransferase (TagB/SpsB family)
MSKGKSTLRSILGRLSQQLVGLPLSLFSVAVPKDERLCVLGAWHGYRFADNPRYLFQEAARNDLRLIWVTRSTSVKMAARSTGGDAFLWWEPKGLWAASRASMWFFSHSPADISPLLPYRATRIYLSHGTPLKRIGESLSGRVPTPLQPLRRAWKRLTPRPQLACVGSLSARDRFSKALALDVSQVVVTGYPRWRNLAKHLEECPASDLTTHSMRGLRVLYAPTHRRYGVARFDAASLPGFRQFTEWCSSNGAYLFVRDHFSQQNDVMVDASRFWRDMSPAVVDDINDILGEFDVLITDYSSIFYDYAMFRNRMAFLAPDLDDYVTNDQGLFVDDYVAEVPGPVFDDWHQILAWFRSGSPIDWSKLRRLRDLSDGVIDGEASSRVIQAALAHRR